MPEEAAQTAPDFERGQELWAQALTVARLLALNAKSGTGHHFKGVHLRAGAGPVRDAWLAAFSAMLGSDAPIATLAPDMPSDRVIGGLDIAGTLASGQTRIDAGLLARAHGGCLLISGADRMSRSSAALLCPAIDERQVKIEIGNKTHTAPTDFIIIACDESDPHNDDGGQAIPPALASRLPVIVDLHPIGWHDICANPMRGPDCEDLPQVVWDRTKARPDLPDDALLLIAELARATGASALRRELAMAEMATLLAYEDDRQTVNADDVAEAAFIALGLRLNQQSADDEAQDEVTEPDEQPQAKSEADSQPEQNAEQPDPPSDIKDDQTDNAPLDFDALQDMLIEAVKAGKIELPTIINKVNRSMAGGDDGKAGDMALGAKRGRPAGFVARPPYQGARLNVIATLRTAAPWQKLRRKTALDQSRTQPIIRASDYRYIRYKKPTESTAIFAVDASGSTALDRLAEAKGAIEQLLAECYVRRDQVALVAFRGTHSEVLLEPTRSLVRAKRSLTGLPGGGPTPLADGLRSAIELAVKAKQKGQSPLLVMLTDGRGNIALDGTADRTRARDDAQAVARQAAALGIRTVFIDIAKRPREQGRDLAALMNADYCALPRVDSTAVSAIVSSYLKTDSAR